MCGFVRSRQKNFPQIIFSPYGATRLNTIQTKEEKDSQKAKSKATSQRKIPKETK
jgi:hypothetical protein